jgi:hypothetical protein
MMMKKTEQWLNSIKDKKKCSFLKTYSDINLRQTYVKKKKTSLKFKNSWTLSPVWKGQQFHQKSSKTCGLSSPKCRKKTVLRNLNYRKQSKNITFSQLLTLLMILKKISIEIKSFKRKKSCLEMLMPSWSKKTVLWKLKNFKAFNSKCRMIKITWWEAKETTLNK